MGLEIKKSIYNDTGIALVLIALLFVFPHSGNAFEAEEIPEPESWKFPDIVESARKIAPRNVEGKLFNTFGLVYSNDELKNFPLRPCLPRSFKSMQILSPMRILMPYTDNFQLHARKFLLSN